MMSWISRSLRSLTLRRSSITAAAALLTALGAASGNAVVAATLPVPCAPGVCGANRTPGFGQPAGFVTSGSASAVQSGNTLTVTQASSQAILNWQSFNVSADGRVIFQQPSSTAIALNRIYQNSPSSIFGQLSANGQVYLLNPNGFVFGATSSVNVAGLVASSLGITDDVFAAGILSPGAATNNPKPAFSSDGRTYVVDSSGNPVLDANGNKQPIQIVVQPGAQMTATGGGRIMLAAQNVTNGGSLSAPDGQIVLAAGQSLYLQGSSDPSMRGLVVEVSGNTPCSAGDPCTGVTSNQAGAVLSAPRGNVSLIGMAVNQSGRISATTSVSANGSVILQAANETLNSDGGTNCHTQGSICGNQGGKLEFGATSEIDVLLDTTDTSTAVVGQKQIQSSIQLSGQQVDIAGQITAPGGSLNVVAAANPDTGLVTSGNTAAQIRVAAGTNINLHGSDASLPMSANLQTIQLRGNELEDDPVQRDGPLRGLTAIVDVRNGKPAIISEDSWQSLLQAIPETIAQRTSVGGTVSFKSEGDVVVNKGSTIDVSGGKWTYAAGVAQTTQLIGANGRLYDISTADPSLLYTGVLNPTYTVNYNGFGVQVTNTTPGLAHYSAGYVQGFSAGSVTFAAPSMALQGSLVGTAVNGIYQRDASKIPTESLLGFLTGGHGIASGGTLTIGLSTPVFTNGVPDFFSPGVIFANDTAPIVVADGAPLPPQTLQLSPSYISAGGFAQTQIFSDSTVTLPAGMPLNLGAGGSLQVEAARISINSDIQALSGAISLVSAETSASQAAGASRLGIDIASGVTLDVRGQWTNDSPLAPGSVLAPTYQNGGSITLGLSATNSPLTSGGELVLGDNVSLRASGGAWIQANNAVVGGTGGNITLDASPYQSALQLGNDVSLDAFGVQGAKGGSFSLSASRISVAQSDSWASAQRIDDLPAPTGAASATAPGGAFNIGSSLFSKYGFSNVSLTATAPVLADASNSDVLTVTSGTTINALAQTLQLSPNYLRRGTGGVITGFSQVQTLPQFNRKPVSLTFQVAVPGTGVPSSIIFGDLDIQAGATINADPLSKISLLGQGSLLIDGVLRTAGGSILAKIIEPNTVFDPGYLPDQRIELGQQGVLDVSGTSVLQPNTLHLTLGNVLAGGNVSLIAHRGDIVADSGSLIDIAGASSPLDVQTVGGSGGYRAATIGSAGGSIQVQSVESITLLGSLSAAAGASSAGTLAGGSLEVDLSPLLFTPGPNAAGSVANPLPKAPATIELVSSAGGSTPTASYGNLAVLSIPQLEQSGIDFLKLQADNTISINSNTPLSLAGSLTLDAPNLSVGYGVNAVLNAPYVMLTDTNSAVTTAATAVGGTGSLTVNAQQIALSGLVSLQGAGAATLESSGDVEFEPGIGSGLAGTLAVAGDLTINAARIYPATRMSYTITDSAADGHVTFGSTLPPGQTAASLGTPLSVAGSLTVNATNISSSGTILAPFGAISLNATGSLSLLDGSVLSVSADGAVLPYGQTTLGQTEWIYAAGNTTTQVTGVPTRQVTLNSPNVSFSRNATIDVSGGGDLSSYEWVPGTGGKIDSLGQANASAAGLYAVLPSTVGQYAAFDLQEFTGSSVTPGASVYLSGVSGLAAGVYPLLPARYALLPGAFLVQVEPGFHSLQSGTIGALSDGTAVTAGYLTFGNTGLRSSAGYTGFAVRPGSYSEALAQYQLSSASTYDFAKANPVSAGTVRTVLPADAGTLLIAASNSLSAQGKVNSAAGAGGSAATIEISSSDLTVTAPDEAASSGVSISASVLSSWNAGDLILGGQLSADGKSLLVTANNVTIGTGKALQLSAGQIVALANQSIEVQSGATVASTSGLTGTALKALPDETPLTLTKPDGTVDAGAALLAVSDTGLPIAVRSLDGTTAPITGGATVKVDSGATLSTRGAVALDAPESVVMNGTINGPGASWSLASNSIGFIPDGGPQAAGQPADSLQINSALLSQMQTAGALRLASAGSIDLQTAVQLGVGAAGAPALGSLHLIGNSINNATGGVSVFGAQTVTLEGTTGAAPVAPTAGAGTLTFVADTLNVGPGNLAISGNSQTTLRATGAVAGQGTGILAVAGDVTIAAAEMTAGKTADSPSNTTIAVPGGTLTLVQNGAAAPASSLTSSLGGQLSLTANQIQDSGSIIVPGGRISMTATPGAGGSQATSNINVASNAVIDASGITVSAGDQTVGAAGGIVNLTAAGDLTLAAGSAIKVSGAGEAPGGFLALAAGGTATLGGTLAGNAAADAIGGSFWLDAGQLTGGLASLTGNLTTGGFTNLINVRVQNGNLTSVAGSTLTANQITLTADTGVIDIAGTLNAPSAGQRGSVGLFAGNGVTLESTGSLLANGGGATGRGGEIELSTATGLINLNGGTISASGQAQMGSLLLRAPAVVQTGDVNIGAFASNVSGIGQIIVEPVLPTYQNTGDFTANFGQVQTDIASYLALAAGVIPGRFPVAASSGSTPAQTLVLQPGVVVEQTGDLTLQTALDLYALQLGTPIDLTVRATGNITISGGISDGVDVSSGITLSRAASSSLRFVAGADLTSANPLATKAGGLSNLTLTNNALVRTGTGDIDLVAAHDVEIDSGSSAYTTGTPGAPSLTVNYAHGQKPPVNFLQNGGDLVVAAGNDVVGFDQADPQGVSNWLGRGAKGNLGYYGLNLNAYDNDPWTLATFGGGDVNISAGRDVMNVSAAAADSLALISGTTQTHFNSGGLTVNAGRDITSGQFFVADGVGTLSAGRSFAANLGTPDTPVGSIFELADSQISLWAQDDMVISGVMNPTVLLQPQGNSTTNATFFTYSAASAFNAQSAAGNISMDVSVASITALLGQSIGNSAQPETWGVNPASLQLSALTGNLNATAVLFPSDNGNLRLFAAQNILGQVSMSDAPDSKIPTASNGGNENEVTPIAVTGPNSLYGFFADRHAADMTPATITAGQDIVDLYLNVPKASRIEAGRDIVGLEFFGQNLHPDDLTLVSAGRDFVAPPFLDGKVVTNTPAYVTVAGSGRLDLLAGRNIDLGFSVGVTTVGSLQNPNLGVTHGADITMLAGLGQNPDNSAFLQKIILPSTTYQQQLTTYVESITGETNLAVDQADSEFAAFSADLQRPLINRVFFNELDQSGIAANKRGGGGYTRGYAAIDALFPGSRSGTAGSAANPYSGDLNMDYSQIYTIAGGNITLLVPGGSMNVGLATAPAGTNGGKPPSQLGIVAQGYGDVNIYTKSDVNVNSSRIFTLGGGNIVVWSDEGNIDAGNGAKTSLSLPPPTFAVDQAGNQVLVFNAAVAGSGIRTIQTGPGQPAGNVNLIAPVGAVDAGDAGIGAAGNINLAAATVIGAGNINFGGTATGVPPAVSSVTASVPPTAAATQASSSNTMDSLNSGRDQAAPLAQAALNWLDVMVTGLGEENCKPSDDECIKRQKKEKE